MSMVLEQLGLSAQWLKDVYLFGVDLTDDEEQPFPDSLFEHSLLASVETLERELSIVLTPQRVQEERHRHYQPDQAVFSPIHLDKRPLRQVEKVEGVYGEMKVITFPGSWIQVANPITARLNIIPNPNELPGVLGLTYLPLGGWGQGGLSLGKYVPQFYRVTYRAGFDAPKGKVVLGGDGQVEISLPVPCFDSEYDVSLSIVNTGTGEVIDPGTGASATLDIWSREPGGFCVDVAGLPVGTWSLSWQVQTLDAGLRHAIGLRAAAGALNTAGDLIIGAGIANISRSVDGLSTSIGTTSSATNAGYGARVRQHERELKALLPGLRRKWRRRNMAVA